MTIEPIYNYSVNHQIQKLFLHKYERYLPTAFDESKSLLEKMNKLIEAQNQLIDVVNDHREDTRDKLKRGFEIIDGKLVNELQTFRDELNEQKRLYEEIRDKVESDLLPDTVKEKLENWLIDGTIERLINEEIFTEFIEKLEAHQNRVESIAVSVKDFGAMGDDTEQHRQIQEALNFVAERGGGKVYMPAGEYPIRETLTVDSNVTLEGEGHATKIKRLGLLPTAIQVTGSFGTQSATTDTINKGDTRIPVRNGNYFSSNDYVRLMSQRDATSDDAGEDYRMGISTSKDHLVYLGEILKVEDVENDVLLTRAGTLFPGYLTHNNNETSSKARKQTTAQKINFKENVHIGKFELVGLWTDAIKLDVCRHSSVYDVTWDDISRGALLTLTECYSTEGVRLKAFYNPRHIDSHAYYFRNPFKTRSCYMSGFTECEAHYASQMVDVTYYGLTDEGSIIDMYSYVKHCKSYNATTNGMTVHGGTYMTHIDSNHFINCAQSGVGCRARNATITNNIITGVSKNGTLTSPEGYGVSLFDGFARDSIVDGNTIKGFDSMVQISDGSKAPYTHAGIQVSNNMFSDFLFGVAVRRPYGNTIKDWKANITIQGNTFKHTIGGRETRAVYLHPYIRQVIIRNNTFLAKDDTSRGIRGSTNTWGVYIIGNVFDGYSSDGSIYLYPVTDMDVYNYTVHRNYLATDNMFTTNPRKFRLEQVDWFETNSVDSIHPFYNGSGQLGNSSRRWGQLYSEMQPNVSSDASLKENITPVSVGLDFLKNVKAVTYNKAGSEKTEYGVIAQDVIKAFESSGVDTETLTMLSKDEDGKYGLSYNELIPIIINSLLELNDRIK